jgi:hypothetical protein
MTDRSFYIPFEWLQANWKDIHGAFHVNVKRIGGSSTDARRLSRYLVSQYCGGQDALVRLSQSRPERPLGKMRESLRKTVRSLPERYEYASVHLSHLPPAEFDVAFKKAVWMRYRDAWDALVCHGYCELFEVKLVWLGDRLERM